MEREMKAAVQAWKVANGKAAAPEHQGWSKARRGDLLVNGVYAISKAGTIKGGSNRSWPSNRRAS